MSCGAARYIPGIGEGNPFTRDDHGQVSNCSWAAGSAHEPQPTPYESHHLSHFTDLITVVLVEDHLALRKGIELLLGRRGCVVAGTAEDARAGFEVIKAKRPDVAVVDLGLPGESGAQLACQVLEERPEQEILLYTGIDDLKTISGALDCGAKGFVHKAASPEELTSAIHSVASGRPYIDRRIGSALLARSTTERVRELSPREREILDLLAQGLSGAEIAKQLFLSPETVRTHIRNAMTKLQARTRVHAIALALQQHEIGVDGSLPPPAPTDGASSWS